MSFKYAGDKFIPVLTVLAATAMFFIAVLLAPPAQAAHISCPTSGSGVTCFGGEFFCPSTLQCYAHPPACSGDGAWNCSACACQCTGVCNALGSCYTAAEAPGTKVAEYQGGSCASIACPSGRSFCSSNNTCRLNSENTCPSGMTWNPCDNSCSTPNVLLSPGGSAQSGRVDVTGDVKFGTTLWAGALTPTLASSGANLIYGNVNAGSTAGSLFKLQKGGGDRFTVDLFGSLTLSPEGATGGDLFVRGGDISNPAGALNISSAANTNVTIQAPGTGTVVLDSGNGQVSIASGDTLTVQNLTVTGLCTGCGGGSVNPTGTGAFDAGTQGTPSVSFATDTNTGMFHPAAADNIAFATGGIQRMVVDENGNVGIGWADPTVALDVNGSIRGNNYMTISAYPGFGAGQGSFWYDGTSQTVRLISGSNMRLDGGNFTAVGTITGTSFSGNGANLTSLSASNLSSGTVGTARLGSGTADATTYLRGDGTWASPGGTAMSRTGIVVHPTITTDRLAVGGTTVENAEGWSAVIDVAAGPESKINVRATNAGVNTRLMAIAGPIYGAPIGGAAGTYSNHPFSLITNQATRMSITAAGDVGIGTVGPAAKLQVNPSVNVEGFRIIASNYSPIVVRNSADSADLFRVNETGTVQVPRTSYVGSTATGGNIQVGVSGGAQIGYVAGGGGDYLQFITHRAGVSHAARMTLDVDGNLGIGTAAPTAKLQINPPDGVEGLRIIASNFSPIVVRNSANNADLFRVNETGTIQVPRTSYVGSTATGGNIQVGVSGGAQVGYVAGGGGDYLQFITHHAGVSHAARMTLDVDGNLFVGSGNQFQVSASGDLVKIDNVAYNWPAGQGGSGSMLMNDGSGNLSWGSSGGVTLQQAYDADPNGGDATITTNGTDGKLLIAGDQVFAYSGSNNVGIGTSSPNDKLHVTGNIQVPRTSYVGSSAAAAISIGLGGGAQIGFVQSGIDDIIQFITHRGGSTHAVRMTLDRDGNLGIGTAAPAAMLEVAGQVKITGGTPGAGKVLTSDAVGLAAWQTPAPGGGVGGSGTTNRIAKFTGVTSVGDSLLFDTGTHVGIGTTTPNYGAYVAASVATTIRGGSSANSAGVLELGSNVADANGVAQGDLVFFNSATTDTEKRQSVIRGATDGTTANNRGGQLQFLVQNNGANTFTQAMTIRQTGDVGIGTGSPDGKLNLSGGASWTSAGWSKSLRVDGIGAIEFGGGAATKYGIGQSGGSLYFFDTTSETTSAAANYRMVLTNAQLGIGGASGGSSLDIGVTSNSWTSNTFWGKAIELPHASVIKWETDGSGQRWGIGALGTGGSADGLYFMHAPTDTTSAASTFSMHLSDYGQAGIGVAPASYSGTERLKISGGTSADTWINVAGSSNGVAYEDVLAILGQGGTTGFVGTATNHDFEIRRWNTPVMKFLNGSTQNTGLFSQLGRMTVTDLSSSGTALDVGMTFGGAGAYAIVGNGGAGVGVRAVTTTGSGLQAAASTGIAVEAEVSASGGTAGRFQNLGNAKSVWLANNNWGLQVNGGAAKPGGGSWSDSSDQRVKKDIHEFTDGLELVRKLHLVGYTYNGLGSNPEGLKGIGVIAQEVQKIAPYMVSVVPGKLYPNDATNTDLLYFNPSAMDFINANAIKTLDLQIVGLEAKVNERLDKNEAKLKALEERVRTLETEAQERK